MKQEIADRYLLSLDEIHKVILVSTQDALEEYEDVASRAEQIASDLEAYLMRAYREGVEATAEMLGVTIDVDWKDMDTAIWMLIDGETFADRVYDHVLYKEWDEIETLAESEYHRVYETGSHDAAMAAWKDGLNVVKRWDTMRDDKVRDTHDYLEGTKVRMDEEFFTFDGDSARFPGDFSQASNNVNCRCSVEYVIEP